MVDEIMKKRGHVWRNRSHLIETMIRERIERLHKEINKEEILKV